MRRLALFAFALTFLLRPLAQTGGPALTDEQRKEIIRLAALYPGNPDDPALDQQASAAAKLLITPEFPASTCADHLPWIEKKKYKYGHELSVAYYLGTGSYIAQHAEMKPSRVYYPSLLAGAEAAITAYQAVLRQDSSAKLDKLDEWMAKQQSGQLMAFLEEKCQRPNPAMSREKVPLTPDEKQRIIELAGELQKSPIDPALRPEFQELFIVVIQAPDITVNICSASELWMDDKPQYKYGPDLLRLELIAMAAYILQNPETGKPGPAHNRAGLTACLRGYEAILKQEPNAHSKALDEALLLEKQGGLDEWFRTQYAKSCSKQK